MKECLNPQAVFGELKSPYRYPETLGELDSAKRLYLAGLLEAGAGFSVNNKTGHKNGHDVVFVQTTLYFHDSDKATIDSLSFLFGGSSSPLGNDKSQRWAVYKSEDVLNLLNSCYRYTPSRRGEIDLFRDAMSEIGEDKRNLVNKFNEAKKEKKFPDKSVYSELVKEPAFLAGVYAARGHPYVSSDPLSSFDCVYFGSLNKSLMTAIVDEYGGSARDFKNTETAKTQKRVVIGRSAGHRLMHLISPYNAVALHNTQKRLSTV